jgi:transcription antitermination protein NusB
MTNKKSLKNDSPDKGSSGESKAVARAAARLGAVQAIYQLTMDKEAVTPKVVEEFRNHRLGKEVDGDLFAAADEDHFGDVVIGVSDRLGEIDRLIDSVLSDDWKPERLENIMRAILRAGTYEIIARPDVPSKVIINEYMDVAHAFYADSEPGFVNGILDRLAKENR